MANITIRDLPEATTIQDDDLIVVNDSAVDKKATKGFLQDNWKLPSVSVPASTSSTGTPGQVAWDADYVYVCVATDVWKRTPLSTW